MDESEEMGDLSEYEEVHWDSIEKIQSFWEYLSKKKGEEEMVEGIGG